MAEKTGTNPAMRTIRHGQIHSCPLCSADFATFTTDCAHRKGGTEHDPMGWGRPCWGPCMTPDEMREAGLVQRDDGVWIKG